MMHSTLSSQLKSVQLSEVSNNSSSWAWRGGGGGVEPSNVDTIGTNKYVLISFIFQLLDSMKCLSCPEIRSLKRFSIK